MTKKRRTFSPEFKCEAASLVLDKGYSVPEAAKTLGLGESAVRRWVQQFVESGSTASLTRKSGVCQEKA